MPPSCMCLFLQPNKFQIRVWGPLPIFTHYDVQRPASENGGTTLKFLSPFLWKATPLEMRRERREFCPDHAGKGSLLSS